MRNIETEYEILSLVEENQFIQKKLGKNTKKKQS